MERTLQILSGAFSALSLVIALRWVFDPAGAAESLQMIFMEGPDAIRSSAMSAPSFSAWAVLGLWCLEKAA